jgi:hypothetical protein
MWSRSLDGDTILVQLQQETHYTFIYWFNDLTLRLNYSKMAELIAFRAALGRVGFNAQAQEAIVN